MLGMIVAIDKNGLIGYDNTIPWNKPADMKRFRQVTAGGTVVMGRKTFNSIGRCLPKRVNIVVTQDPTKVTKCDPSPNCFSTLKAALEVAKTHNNPIWVIGGAQIYTQMFTEFLEQVDIIDITRVDVESPVRDLSKATFFLEAVKVPKIELLTMGVISDAIFNLIQAAGFVLESEEINAEDTSLTHRRYIKRHEEKKETVSGG